MRSYFSSDNMTATVVGPLEIFQMIDTNGDGVISDTELLLHFLGRGQDDQTIAQLFQSIDANRDGVISRDEWCAGYEKYLALPCPAGGEVVVAGETIVAGETVQPVQPVNVNVTVTHVHMYQQQPPQPTVSIGTPVAPAAPTAGATVCATSCDAANVKASWDLHGRTASDYDYIGLALAGSDSDDYATYEYNRASASAGTVTIAHVDQTRAGSSLVLRYFAQGDKLLCESAPFAAPAAAGGGPLQSRVFVDYFENTAAVFAGFELAGAAPNAYDCIYMTKPGAGADEYDTYAYNEKALAAAGGHHPDPVRVDTAGVEPGRKYVLRYVTQGGQVLGESEPFPFP